MRRAIAAGCAAAAIEIMLALAIGRDRIEPGLFLLWRLPLLAALALFLMGAQRQVRVTGYAAMLAGAAVVETWMAGPAMLAALLPGAVLLLPVELAVRAGMAIGGRWLAGVAALLLLAVPGTGHLVARVSGQDGMPRATGRSIAVLTGVPLRWAESADAGTAGVAPPWALLARAFALKPVDRIEAVRADRWLLVQPRAPGAAGLVAIDTRIRGGVRALILTDPDLRWPSRYPAGDAAGPPRGGTLEPLLRHWGLRLDRDGTRAGFAIRDVIRGGRRWRLALSGAGRFVRAGAGPCRLTVGGLVARCGIGRGTALLVADADLLDPQSWTGPDGRHDPAGRPSDNAAFVTALLAGLDGDAPPVRPVLWMDHGMDRNGLGTATRENHD